jgi:hypothetical protein
MEIRADFLTKALLNLSQADSEGLNLTKGEILKGVVEALKDNGMITVNLKGLLVDALSEVQVSPGQQLLLMVDGFRDGKVYLKPITPQMMDDFAQNKLAATLQQIGMKADETTLALAQKLIQHNLPVTRENIATMLKVTRDLGGLNPRNMELTSLAMAGGVKPEAEAIESLQRFLSRPASVKQALEQALALLENDAASGKNANAAGREIGNQPAAAPFNQEIGRASCRERV